jgi:prevent-host-death family protein
MTVLPLGDVKSHLSELVSRVHDYRERVTVTVHGRPSAILIAPGVEQDRAPELLADLVQNPQSEYERYIATHVIPGS